jgi:ubiquinone biosynthesis protein
LAYSGTASANPAAPSGGGGGRLALDLARLARLVGAVVGALVSLGLLALVGRPPTPALIGQRLRATLQGLGLTYVKLGQFMAMRFDILPEAICRELAQLFDDVAPIDPARLRAALAAELGAPPETVFAAFDATPLAAASVAQVHRARLKSGEDVAVKVQRPGVARIFASDMRNLGRLAGLIDALGVIGPQSVREAVAEFERFTARELDFSIEGATAERLARNAGPDEYAPRIYWDYSTPRILTMELVVGHRLSDIISGQAGDLPRGLDLDEAARNLARACLRQLFVTGFFHADPHPGNIFVRDDGGICFVDFGIFGQLSPARRETFAAYIESVALGDLGAAYRHFMALLVPSDRTDHRRLRRDIEAIFERWRAASADPATPAADRHLGKYVGEFIGAIRDNKVRMGLDTLLFWRTLIVLDATALRFRDSFELLDVMRDFFREVRPGVAERFLLALQDAKPLLAAHRLCQDGAEQAARIAEPHGHWSLPIVQSQDARTANRRAKAVVLALLVVGAIVFAARVSAPALAGQPSAKPPPAIGAALMTARRPHG